MKLLKPRIQPVQENELTTEQRELLEPLGQFRSFNVVKTLIRHPKLFQRFLPFALLIIQESTLPSREKELLILRISWLWKSEYEWSHHAISGKQAGLTDQEILRITKGPNAEGWSSFDATLLQAVDELHKDAFISDSTWVTLAEKFTEQQLIDLVFTVGQYSLVSMALNSIGVQLDEDVTGFPK